MIKFEQLYFWLIFATNSALMSKLMKPLFWHSSPKMAKMGGKVFTQKNYTLFDTNN